MPKKDFTMRDILRVTVGFNRGTSTLSKAIQSVDDSFFNHVWLGITYPTVELLVESLEHGIQLTPREHLERAKKAGKLTTYYEVELPHLSQKDRTAIYDRALTVYGRGYDFKQLLRYLLWLKLGNIFKKSVLSRNDSDRFTCNELVIYTLKPIVQIFKHTDYSYTPERIFRLLHDGKTSKEIFGKARG